MNNKLFNLRESKDLLQKEIAEIIGVHRRTYSSWETKTTIVPLKHLNSLSNYYNVSMDYLLCLTNKTNYKNSNKLKTLNKNQIGQNLKQLREEKNLTIRDLAKVLNTTSSSISAYETGKTMILTAFAYQLCLKYKISLDWLCGKID